MNILVTGGAGFIGSHLCDALLKEEHTVICVDSFTDYYDPKRKEKNIVKAKQHKNFTVMKVDIIDLQALKNVFEEHKIDHVVHLAAIVGVRYSIGHPFLCEETNVKGTLNILECCRNYGVKNIVIGSSSSVYGENKKIPFSEDDPTNNIISPYAATKRAVEIMCSTYSKLYNLNSTCLRFFTVYGPRGRPEMAPYKFTKAVYEGTEVPMFGDGSTQRDYTYIADIVVGIVAAVKTPFAFEIINLGNNRPISLKDFIATIEEVVGKKASIRQLPMQPGDVPITYANISKAKRLLGYRPKTPIREGLQQFFAWYKNG